MNAPDDSISTRPVELDADQAQEVGGGNCTVNDLVQITQSLTQAYENLIDFTSHVIERVASR